MSKTWIDRLQDLQHKTKSAAEWAGSRNAWIRDLAPREKGSLAVSLYVEAFGGSALSDTSIGYDIDSGSLKIESKLSTRSYSGTNGYVWLQIRDQDPYTHLWLVAVDVDTVRCFLVPRNSAEPHLLKQHGRTKGTENTCQIKTSRSTLIPAWLAAHEVPSA